VTHRKIPSTTSQNFKSATYEVTKKSDKYALNPETAVKLHAQPSLVTTAGSWKLTILTDKILGERKESWIGKR
jgi:hypothetical protein